jgi:hypothetical protein
MHPEPFRTQPRPAPLPRTGSELLGQVRGILADLDGYIERRAEEKAGPVIEAAAESAREMATRVEDSAQAEIARLQAELRDMAFACKWHQDRMDGFLGRLAVALGHEASAGLWPAVVAEIETQMKEKTDD